MNERQHRISAAIAVGTIAASVAPKEHDRLSHAIGGCLGGFCFGTLPDLVEPAISPNHRQFFHSFAFASVVGYGLYKLYRWEPESVEAGVVRILGLLAGGAYLVHLSLDATTKRSLPILGRL